MLDVVGPESVGANIANSLGASCYDSNFSRLIRDVFESELLAFWNDFVRGASDVLGDGGFGVVDEGRHYCGDWSGTHF